VVIEKIMDIAMPKNWFMLDKKEKQKRRNFSTRRSKLSKKRVLN
jgi:hypothetical protein